VTIYSAKSTRNEENSVAKLILFLLLFSIALIAKDPPLSILASKKSDAPLLSIWKQAHIPVSLLEGNETERLSQLHEQNLSLAIVNSHCAYYAYQGEEAFAKKAFSNLRSIVALYPKILTLIVSTKSGITSFEDIKKSLPKLATTSLTCDYILNFLNLHINQHTLSIQNAATALKEGKIDGFFTLVAHPNREIARLTKEQNITFVPLYGKRFDQLNNDYPFILKSGIPKGLYPGVTDDIKSIAIKALLVTTKESNESIIYNLTKNILENMQRLKTSDPIYRGISKKSLLEELSIPQHQGAIKAFNAF
jgi:TRAP transporter TAXI family solute receptor